MRVYSSVTANVVKSNDVTNSDLLLGDFTKAIGEYCRVMEVSPKIVRKAIADIFFCGHSKAVTTAECDALKRLIDFYEVLALVNDQDSSTLIAYVCINLNTGAQFVWVA